MGIMLQAVVTGTPAWQVALQTCNLLAFVLLLVRIVSIRLTGSYPALVVWTCANIAMSALALAMPMSKVFYYWFYIVAASAALILYLLAVLELYSKVLTHLAGFASAVRLAIPAIVTISVLISASLLPFEGTPVRYIDWFYRIDHVVIVSLIVFVLIITGFLAWFPIRVPRNSVVYSVGYAAYLVPAGAVLFLANSGHRAPRMISTVGMIMSSLSLFFWAVALNAEGEKATVSPGHVLHPQDEDQLIRKLEAINRTLLRVTEK
jgi:hypothetical protein